MPKWLVALSSSLLVSGDGSDGECVSGDSAAGPQSSAMLQMRAGRAVKLSLEQSQSQFKDIYDSAVEILKDGATPEVMALADKTIKDIESSVMPAVHSAHATDEKLFQSTLTRFDEIAVDYKKKQAELDGSRAKEDKISGKHVACRGKEKSFCTAARECEKERLALWEVFLQRNKTYTGDSEQLCDMDSQAVTVRERHYEAVVSSGAERFAAWKEHEAKRKACEQKTGQHEAQSAECNLLKTELEELACDSHLLYVNLWEELTSEWALALTAYNTVRSAVEKEQSDRHRELQTLTEVKCLMKKIYERSGKPCTEQEVEDGVVDEVERSCKEEGEKVDLKPVTITFTDPPKQPSKAEERPYPCQSAFLSQHYGSFMGEACFDEMPQCRRCGGLSCPEPNVVFQGKCFYIHEERKQFNYQEAGKYCSDTGGQIASIHSKEENTAVLGLLRDPEHDGQHRSSYIGATRKCSSPTDCTPWSWDDGSEWVEPNWPTDRLNSNGGTWKNGETHIVIHKDGKWHDWERGAVVRDVLCQFDRTTTTTTVVKLPPVPSDACPPPKAELFKICSLWGDPHFPSTFAHKDFTAKTRHATHSRGKVVNHYDLGLFWLFRSKDKRIQVQGFFCDARGKFNSLSMLVVKVGDQRLFWKRPDNSFPAWGDHIKGGNKWGMDMTVDGKPVSVEDISDAGMSTPEFWFQKMTAAGWLAKANEPMCLGTHDQQFTLKMATPGLSKVFEPVLVLELAKDLVDLDPNFLCSMDPSGGVKVVEAVSFEDSLFTVDELHGMCDGCGMKAKKDPRHKDFSGCNVPAREPLSGEAFCKEQGASAELLKKCEHLKDDWKEACLIEVCAVGEDGADDTDEMEGSGPDSIRDALVATNKKCPFKHSDRLFRQPKSGNTPPVATLAACRAICESTKDCKFYSYQTPHTFGSVHGAQDHDGVCQGCTSDESAEYHQGFNLYQM